MARLALEATADPDHPAGDDDAKRWAHGLVDADAFVDAHDPGAPPGLVLEVSGGKGGGHGFGSGDGQLPHPDTTWVACAFKADGDGVAANPGTASFSGAVADSAGFSAVDGDSGTFKATLASGPLDPGLAEESASATDDVFGQLSHAVARGGGEQVGCPTPGLHFQAPERATYLLDLFATGATGGYRLTWTVSNAAGLPIEVATAACSPNGDGVQDRCAWSAGAIPGWTVRSFVTSGATLVAERDGTGAKTWMAAAATPAATACGSSTPMTAAAGPCCGPSPSPLTRRGRGSPTPRRPQTRSSPARRRDRDTTTFAMTSSERGRLRVVIDRYATTDVVRVLVSGELAAGRQRVFWTGRTSAGAWLRGRFSYVLEASDLAGNTARSQRHSVRVL